MPSPKSGLLSPELSALIVASEASSGPDGGSGPGVRPHPAGLTQQSDSQLHCRVKDIWAISPATRAQWDQVTAAYRKRGKGRARPEHVPRHILLAFLRSRGLGEDEEDEETEREDEGPSPTQQGPPRPPDLSSGAPAAHPAPATLQDGAMRADTLTARVVEEPRTTTREPPLGQESSLTNTNPDEKILDLHAHLLQQPGHGDWMSVIGSRFRIRLAEVRSWFVVSDTTGRDA